MSCPACGSEVPADANFCGKCGSRLARVCTSCGAESPLDHNFCGRCGTPLTSELPSRPKREPRALEFDRGDTLTQTGDIRPVTVLFCDLVGSVSLAERLDPEDLRDVIGRYREVCSEVVERYGGFVAQLLGDGVMVYFGFPRAHEYDPQRAVHTGLDLLIAVAKLSERFERERNISLAVRVGIHTGQGIAGPVSVDTRETLVLGQAPNIAARLQSIAQPGTVVISGDTFPLIRGYFVCESLGPHALAGLTKPVEVHRVIGKGQHKTPFEIAREHGLSHLVGRESEIDLLERSLDRVTEGRGQVVAIVGEAGIGKSRLIQQFRDRERTTELRWFDCRCSPYQQNSALAPVVDHLNESFQLKNHDSTEENLRRLERELSALGLDGEEVALFASLLGLPTDRFVSLGLSSQRQKERTLEALISYLIAIAEKETLIFFVEDLHWIDPSTRELLDMIVAQGPALRILTLVTTRPSFPLPWSPRAHATQITLDRLTNSEAERLILDRAGRPLPEDVLHQLVLQTDGVPLFVEELTRMVLESGLLRNAGDRWVLDGPLPPLAIPATLQDSLMARLDRLAAVREIVQLAAAIGREFSYEMIRAVADRDDRLLRRGLDQLVEAEILYKHGAIQNVTYSFKHALIQDAAYASMLKSTRQRHHLRIARVLEERFPEIADPRPEIVAQHYTEAGLAERAVVYWLSAARRTLERSANLEAIGHVERGLAQVESFTSSGPKARFELELRTVLGPALIATRGYGAHEVEANYARAQALCAEVGEAPQLFWVLRGLWAFHLIRNSFERALEIAERMMEIAEQRAERALLFEAHLSVAMPELFLGDFDVAERQLENALALDSPARDPTPRFITGLDVAVTTLGISAVALWHLGRFREASRRSRAAIDLARDIGHPFSLADALSSAGWVHHLLLEPAEVLRTASELRSLSQEKGFLSRAHSEIQLAWALSRSKPQGEPEEPNNDWVARARAGVEAYRASGARLSEIYFLWLLVEVCFECGRLDEAREVLAEARRLADELGPRFFWHAQLHILDGELSQGEEARRSFERALHIAESQGSRALALRARLGLARELEREGHSAEIRALLGPILATLAHEATAELETAREIYARHG